MYAMSGGTIEHARIATNMIQALDAHFGEGPCRTFSSDVRVQVAEEKYFYPDVTVSCNPEDSERGVDTIRFPRFIVEVLSPSTENYNRGKKFRSYQKCPSIQEYVLISSEHQEVEIYHRHKDVWVYQQFEAGQEIRLASFNLTIPMATLYRLTNVPEQESE